MGILASLVRSVVGRGRSTLDRWPPRQIPSRSCHEPRTDVMAAQNDRREVGAEHVPVEAIEEDDDSVLREDRRLGRGRRGLGRIRANRGSHGFIIGRRHPRCPSGCCSPLLSIRNLFFPPNPPSEGYLGDTPRPPACGASTHERVVVEAIEEDDGSVGRGGYGPRVLPPAACSSRRHRPIL